jgi:hypothetical protein
MSCRYPSLYEGLSQQALQAALTAAQNALIQLNTGAKGVTFSYAQGDGVKTVTYTPASREGLVNFIREMQAALGIIPRARRVMRFIYR